MTLAVSKWGNREQILEHFNPSIQTKCGEYSQLSVLGDYPTLATLRASYGANTPIAWLIPQLYNLSEYCGAMVKMNAPVLQELARIITTEYYYLKVTELMLFFYRFKARQYGKMYGVVDPLVICEGLRDFVKERNLIIEKAEKEREKQERKKMFEGTISLAEWEEIKKKASNTSKTHALNAK